MIEAIGQSIKLETESKVFHPIPQELVYAFERVEMSPDLQLAGWGHKTAKDEVTVCIRSKDWGYDDRVSRPNARRHHTQEEMTFWARKALSGSGPGGRNCFWLVSRSAFLLYISL